LRWGRRGLLRGLVIARSCGDLVVRRRRGRPRRDGALAYDGESGARRRGWHRSPEGGPERPRRLAAPRPARSPGGRDEAGRSGCSSDSAPTPCMAEDFLHPGGGAPAPGPDGGGWTTLLKRLEADPRTRSPGAYGRLSLDAGRPLQAAENARRLAALRVGNLGLRAPRGGAREPTTREEGPPRGSSPPGAGRPRPSRGATRWSTANTGPGPPRSAGPSRPANGSARSRVPGRSRGRVDPESGVLAGGGDPRRGGPGQGRRVPATMPDPSRALRRGGDLCRVPPGAHSVPAGGPPCLDRSPGDRTARCRPAPAPNGPPIGDRRSRTEHRLGSEANRLLYETTTEGRPSGLRSLLVGSGRQTTFLGHRRRGDSGNCDSPIRGRVTWDLTTGQDPTPATPGERLGRSDRWTTSSRRCLRGMSRDPDDTRAAAQARIPRSRIDASNARPRAAIHSPGRRRRISRTRRIARPAGDLRRRSSNSARGARPAAVDADARRPRPARSQAPGLKLSACYRESRGAQSCVTCTTRTRESERSPRVL